MFKLLLIIFFFSIYSNFSFSKGLIINGNEKLSITDIQALTVIDLNQSNFDSSEINSIINDLYNSDLIYDLNLTDDEKNFILTIEENKIINQIYLNNNEWFSDNQILDNLKSKNKTLFSKNRINEDINIIKSIYSTKGFNEITIVARLEKFSNDRLNLIYDISEGDISQLNSIEFIGNFRYSDKFLSSKISSKALKFYNFFSSGSNLNKELFDFDLSKITNLYREDGYFDVKTNYSIEKNNFGNYKLIFYINEGTRYVIKSVNYDKNFEKFEFLIPLKNSFENTLLKKDMFYNKNIISNYMSELNELLLANNIVNLYADTSINTVSEGIDLNFFMTDQDIIPIKKINIFGNNITKDKTIRSKILFQPGDYFNKYLYENSKQTLSKYRFIKGVESKKSDETDGATITYNIKEEVKTGNLIFAGTFDTDTEFGINFGITDENILGTGNKINADFNINSEDVKFDLSYTQYSLTNPYLSHKYLLFNQENDLTDSFGFKSRKRGLGYGLNFDYDENVKFSLGFSYQFIEGYSPTNSEINSISDNIGNFNNFIFDFNINRDTTNDLFNPTDGHKNNLSLVLSPYDISDDTFIKLYYTNKNYFSFKDNNNYLFFNNNIGLAESFDSKLKTINAFSLGGRNFRGFDYRGIGPISNGIYLGGNKIFTSTVGYGSSFLFDDKDNIDIKLFLTSGSIWDSDYTSDNEFNLRSSTGISFDFLTAIGPISFSYAIPIEKNKNDTTRAFSFSIGTTF